jgi:hypothetical protein
MLCIVEASDGCEREGFIINTTIIALSSMFVIYLLCGISFP